MLLPALVFYLSVVSYVCCDELNANTTVDYDPTQILEDLFNSSNRAAGRARFGQIQFEDQQVIDVASVNNDAYNANVNDVNQRAERFEDGEVVDQDNTMKKKRRRRKLKQKYGELVQPQQYNNGIPYYPYVDGENFIRPQRPRPSVASQALSSVTDALTSIARYDDYQCVPRLLCESASGGALGSSQILPSVSGLEPLLTLLSAYNGISANPLFVFGRAVFLGMSSKGNSASCRYAYPLCPTDTEKLIHYLNNHNGGFFRFFNGHQKGPQNLDQFYNQLYQNPNQQYNQNNNGMYTSNQGYYGIYKPNLYSTSNQGYGLAYPYNVSNYIRFRNNNNSKIEKRIQNKPIESFLENSGDTKWKFPGSSQDNEDIDNDYIGSLYEVNDNFENYDGNILRFPDSNLKIYNDYDDTKKSRGFAFPENQNIKHITNYNFPSASIYNSNEKFVFGNRNNRDTANEDIYNNVYNNYMNHKHKYIYPKQDVNNDVADGVQTVYVVRGDGDARRPEIVKLRPGQSIQQVL